MGSGRGPTASSGAALRSTPTPVVITVWETPGAIILLHADGLRAGGCGLERSAAQADVALCSTHPRHFVARRTEDGAQERVASGTQRRGVQEPVAVMSANPS